MNNNSLVPAIIIGLSVITVTTIPIWLPYLLGKNIKKCECGVQLTSGRFNLYCKSYY